MRDVPQVLLHERQKVKELETKNQQLQQQVDQLNYAMQKLLALPQLQGSGISWQPPGPQAGPQVAPASTSAATATANIGNTATVSAVSGQQPAALRTFQPTLITMADGLTQVQGYRVETAPGSGAFLTAYRTPADPMGYHESQQGSQCARHTLNMLEFTGTLATDHDYRAFLKAKYTLAPPKVSLPSGGNRDATAQEIDDIIRKDTGTSLEQMVDFQTWRKDQGIAGLRVLSLQVGNMDNENSLDATKQALGDAESFGVSYRKKGTSADHAVAIRRVDGVFRVYDSQKPDLPELNGTTAMEALRDFMERYAARVQNMGLQFECLVPVKNP